MAQWHSSESGILRKNKKKDNFEDLLVFGYSCKVFRDDEKALYIDQGKHLIPWMGDEKLKIDRYDCRGHLTDLNRYESSREGYDAMRWLGLDENERKLEQLCDQERYYSLRTNEEEEQMYKEEEEKRNKTNAFQYSYDVPTNPEAQEPIPTVPEFDENEKYVPPTELDVPVDIAIPKTVKENARIEKTAMFVSTQGPQMEILIKAKQNDNPQFSFLNQSDPLYKFYRHVLNAIKNGRYNIKSSKNDRAVASNSGSYNVSGGDSGDHYLHPSLVSSANSNTDQLQQLPTPASTIPSVPYKPSANCAYSQLVNRIQGTSNKGQNGEEKVDQEQMSADQQQQYYQYYLQQQYYEYYKNMTQNKAGNVRDETKVLSDKPIDPQLQTYFQQMMYAQYIQQPSNPYAQIVSNVKQEVEEKVVKSEETKPSSVLSLIQSYGSDSDDEYEEDKDYKIPEDEIKVVIDKMASYVIKNGSDFENIVKSRADPRFEFLNETHEFYKYYRKKLSEERKKKKELEESEKKSNANAVKEKKVIAPVSFSIKKPKVDEHPKEIRSALPVDEDTDDEEENIQPAETPNSNPINNDNSRIVYNTTESKTEEVEGVENTKNSSETKEICVENETEKSENVPEIHEPNVSTPPDDLIMEMIDLTEDKIDTLDETCNESKKLNVRENRALQLERRRKAMAFLKMKSTKKNENSPSSSVPTIDLSNVNSPKRTHSENEHETRHKKSKRSISPSDGELNYSSSNSDDEKRRKSHRKKRSHKRKHSKSSRHRKRSSRRKRRSSSSSRESSR